jgi:hypothetical protein
MSSFLADQGNAGLIMPSNPACRLSVGMSAVVTGGVTILLWSVLILYVAIAVLAGQADPHSTLSTKNHQLLPNSRQIAAIPPFIMSPFENDCEGASELNTCLGIVNPLVKHSSWNQNRVTP